MAPQERGAISCRRIVVERFGGVEELREVETTVAAPPPGHTRVKVIAAGVGFTDLMARAGEYLLQRKVPFCPGYELVGEVVDTSGEGMAPGTLVAAALPKMGTYTEYVVLPNWLLVPLPDGLDPHLAAAVPLDYLTALSVLETHGRVARGDTVLIQGASGGVGQALSQLGRRSGLRMYGTASASGSAERLARYGVEYIDYRRQDFETIIREREPHGIQAVFDHIGGANLAKSYRVLAPGGVLVSYAFVGRPGHMISDTVRGAARVKLMNMRPGRRAALCMVPRELKTNRDWYRVSLERLLTLARSGEIEPSIAAIHPLAKASDVHAALERREITGKIVLTAS
ncbi:oxidoreductase, zinc-binding dehydrogenase family protein [Streptomyces bingchenggensis BCW-1]|uniref:Oxidoreductase, zinc-binding dehydrogenase family protein n=1 Tax=Streptomyces bingchenggensis (strain BCW-1) TaxID=749414 RepID=D7BR72_STRBB|nr:MULTISPECIES: zinc-binding dehydrogenase [Streptomyces]ADI11422.1 oxidoreductase, zinc-binding dehydrogenase family protein [Streptomyces bingchenggensis BCW-1]